MLLSCLLSAALAAEPPRLAWSARIPVDPPWPASQDRLQFDRAPVPVVAGGRVFVCASGLDAVLALDPADGRELWRFHPEAPARLPPASDGRLVFVGADDGRVYALDAATGAERWRREPPARRLVLGNDRMISTWPVRGGPVLADGTLYVASGLYPFMGTFVAALDPATGAERWCQSGDGAAWTVQQHNSPAFAGIAPQGTLVVAGELVLVPGGRSLPAAYRRDTGAPAWSRIGERVFDKGVGSSAVLVAGTVFVAGGGIYRCADGQALCPVIAGAADATTVYGVGADQRVHAWALPPVRDPQGGQRRPWRLDERWSATSDPPPAGIGTTTGGLVYGWSADGRVLAYATATGALAWQVRLGGSPRSIVVDGDRILVGTAEGWLHALAPQAPAQPVVHERTAPTPSTAGYALVLSGATAPAGLHAVHVEPDPARAAQLRAQVAGAATVLTGTVAELGLPPYWAEQVVGDAPDAALACLRPGSGRAAGAVRPPLPGAGWWTHQYGNAGQTVSSSDTLVRGPLGLLWFGGPANDEVLPRHGHGPAPLVVDGRLFIEGRDMVRAVDIYTGRLLWQVALPGIGQFYDNTSHQPGANEIGSNLCAASDALYVMAPDGVRVLDPATGAERTRIGAGLRWGALCVDGDHLVARLDPVQVSERGAPRKRGEDDDAAASTDIVVDTQARWGAASRVLAVFDRQSGAERWRRVATQEFRHNALAVAGGSIVCIDGATSWRLGGKRAAGTLLALDLATGAVRWTAAEPAFGTWIAADAGRDVVIEGGSSSRDRAVDEVGTGLRVRRLSDGSMRWASDMRYAGPPILVGSNLYTQPSDRPAQAFVVDSGLVLPWQLQRGYGCNTAIGAPHLLAYRSASAAYHDLDHPWGTISLGGFKSGCTANLIPAGGILNAPDYTRTCTCGYQIQASLALVPDPTVEAWSMRGNHHPTQPVAEPLPPGRIARLGLNLGAPGDRVDDTGTPWLAWPAPWKPAIAAVVEAASYRREHSLRASGPLPWVAASAAVGCRRVELPLSGSGTYTVTLVFPAAPTARVRVQGREVPTSGAILTVPAVAVDGRLVVELDPPTALAGVSAVIVP